MGFSARSGVWPLLCGLLLGSCVRFELEESDPQEIALASSALRISGVDSVILCPLAASLESSGNVSIVWAGYPASDDRLQLMHARVSSRGALLQQPRGLALLEDELDSLSLRPSRARLEVRALEREAEKTLRIDLSADGQVAGSSLRDVQLGDEQAADFPRLSASTCGSSVITKDARLHILRAQVDGELPLFVESYPL